MPAEPEQFKIQNSKSLIGAKRPYVRLNSDENPYGCSLNVQDILGSSDLYHLPPDPVCGDLRAALSDYTGFSSERIVVGAGTTELTERMFHAFLDAGDALVTCPPSLPHQSHIASRARHSCAGSPHRKLRSRPRRGYNLYETPDEHQNGGRSLTQQSYRQQHPHTTIAHLLHTGVWVVVDETYFEFSDRTVAPLVAEFDNLVVLRSFGPWAGLNGLPIGYALCSTRAAARLQRLAPPGGVNRAAQLAGLASLHDQESLMQRVRRIRLERGRLYRQLRKLNLLQPLPSAAPFLLCHMTRGTAQKVQRHLQDEGILVKAISDRWLSNHVRIGVGKAEDTNALITALKGLAAQPHL